MFPRHVTGSHLTPTRTVKPPSTLPVAPEFPPSLLIAAATFASGNVPIVLIPTSVDSYDTHVSYTHAYDALLRETARQL